MSWYRLTLSRAQVNAGAMQQCREAFVSAFAAARSPRTMTLFQQKRDDSGLDLFLTPGCREYAAQLLEEWRCIPCRRPSTIGLQLLAGHREMVCYMP
jgi:hypothetical protein